MTAEDAFALAELVRLWAVGIAAREGRVAVVQAAASEPSSGGLRTLAEARAEFDRHGVSIAAWARNHGVSRSLVYEVLGGRKACHRGDSHRIAVLLGIKKGALVPRGTSAAEAMEGELQ
jgi:gp16 family phage-associated protein